MWFKHFFLPINKIVKVLMLSDFILISAFGFIAPIFALFITDKIEGGTIETVGFASALYWVAAILIRLPVARYIDKTKSEKDDFWFMIFGSLIVSAVPFLYIISSKISHIYWIQALYGIGYSLRIPGWYGMFTRHVDKGHEGYEWSFDSIISGVGSGIAAALGGIIAVRLGFEVLFIFIGGLSIVGSAVLIFLYYIVEPNHESGKNIETLSIDGKNIKT